MALDDVLARAGGTLCRRLADLTFAAPVTHVYNPLEYASRPHRAYLRKYATTPKRVVFVGMNPGPYGMAQTGIPFGEICSVREFLQIEEPVGQPAKEHPKRPVLGFGCLRKEVSGARLWGAFRDRYGTADDFFRDHFVANYCPLVFMEQSGRNRTPDKLPEHERVPLYQACDDHLRKLVSTLGPEWVIGVGKFAEGRARHALAGRDVKIGSVLHPSPASPLANRGWVSQAEAQLQALGLPFGVPS
ncbi:MAG: single-stranded DNA-binding protein [Myxococcales bacterium]|nr:single-stranded DNA-binding protein [Myxococcales bacterium]MDD9968811.1 single-stranded DNA-binding protein [Myxococcales bacterium]